MEGCSVHISGEGRRSSLRSGDRATSKNRWLWYRVAVGITSAALVLGVLVALRAPVADAAATASGTLTIESTPTNPIQRDFNPFDPTSADELLGATPMFYEPLYQFDPAQPAKVYPWLATSYRWNHSGTRITFTIRHGVKWSDGTSLSAADVAFTYTLVEDHADINTAGLAITGVATSGDEVTVSFASPQYANLQNIATVPIVPKALWSTVGDPGKYLDADPVGSGPYVLKTFTSEGFTLTANRNYWQPVHVATLDYPIYSSNATALEGLEDGQIQWAGNFIDGLAKLYTDPDPTQHQSWFDVQAADTIVPNTTVWPTSQLAVRQAISDAIDRDAISAQGESGLEPPATNATGLPLPTFKAYETGATTKYALDDHAQPARADAVLAKAGYTIDSAGYYALAGKQVSLTVTVPASYSDYAADGAIIAQDLQAAHIDATFSGQALTTWAADVADGNFQLIIHWSAGGISLYRTYNSWLNSKLATTTAAGDYERVDDPALDADLAKVAATRTVAAQAQALLPLETYVATELPLIPMVGRVAYDEYNTADFVGWPSASDPYASGSPTAVANELVVLHLRPRQ
jgi:peptide/nickel transport system substrate-binding protein